MKNKLALIKQLEQLPFSLQKKFMKLIMEKHQTIDLFKIKKKTFENELSTFLNQETNLIKPYIESIDEMVKEIKL